MMFWLGVYSLAILVLNVVIVVSRNGKATTEYTGGYRLVAILMNLPILWFVYIAWGMYR